jgi:hypothetical protein
MDQNYLNNYFDKVWRHTPFNNLNNPTLSGLALLDKIKPTETVIDIGCGVNGFKKYLPNLVGIDPAFPEADHQLTLEEFSKQSNAKFNVALCLGSINFGDKTYIEQQIGLVTNLLQPSGRIYWRCNPGLQDHGTAECKYIEFYPWTFEEQIRLADKFGFKILEMRWEKHSRIYAEWKKNG